MSDTFVYDWASQNAKEYLEWLGGIQNRCKRRRRRFAWAAAVVFVGGLVFAGVVAKTNIPEPYMLVALGTSLVAGFLMTDTCRGRMYFDPIGAVITDFNSMNEFDIGRFEKYALFGGQGEEVQKLLYCLRISSSLHKYKKIDVFLSRWKTAMEHGRSFFGASPRGKLTLDFLTRMYFFYVHRAFTDYATQQYAAISKLKTATARQNRLEKVKEKLVEILSENREFPRMQELVNATYKAVMEAPHA